MPLYEFSCPSCGHQFEEMKRLAQRDEPEPCPSCGASATREISGAAIHGGGGGGPMPSVSGGGGCAPGG
jgi:putative FmdB family regulatory protein